MYNSECVNEFIDWLTTEFYQSGGYSALQISKFYQDNRSGIRELKELAGGCTNSSVMIEFYDNSKIKLTVYDSYKSPYRINTQDFFLEERNIKNSLYREEFGIISDYCPCITVSEYIEGESFNEYLLNAIHNKEFNIVCHLNSDVIDSISEFHSNNRIKTHRTTLVSIAMLFLSSLKEALRQSKYFDVDLSSTKYMNDISDSINKILLFESKFEDSDFVLSHLDTDPVNMLYSDNKVKLIDFEFTGVGLKYYDYVNYLNAVDSLHLKNLSDNDKSEIRKSFENYCHQNAISNFSHEDFNMSYLIMRFVWGIWYLMYGVKNMSKEYVRIGKEWVLDWINWKDVL